MIRRITAVAGLLLAVLAFASVPSGAQTTPTTSYFVVCSLLVDPPSGVTPGGTINISGQGANPGSTLEATLNGTVIGTTVASSDPSGTFAFDPITIPTTLPPGDYVLEVRLASGGTFTSCDNVDVLTTNLTVSSAGGGSSGGGSSGGGQGSATIPPTGSNSSVPMAQLGAGLLVAGGFAVLATRKRRSPAAT